MGVSWRGFLGSSISQLTRSPPSALAPASQSGSSFVLSHANPRLLNEVLPKAFAHQNLQSFTRAYCVPVSLAWSCDPDTLRDDPVFAGQLNVIF